MFILCTYFSIMIKKKQLVIYNIYYLLPNTCRINYFHFNIEFRII